MFVDFKNWLQDYQDSTGSKDARISGAHQPNSTNLM